MVDPGEGWTVTEAFVPSWWTVFSMAAHRRRQGACRSGLLRESGQRPGHPLRRNVRLIAGTDEETGFRDVKWYYSRHPYAPYTISPDADFPIINIEKGHYQPTFQAAWPQEQALPRVSDFTGGTRLNMVPPKAQATVLGLSLDTVEAAIRDLALEEAISFSCQEKDQGSTSSAAGKTPTAPRRKRGTTPRPPWWPCWPPCPWRTAPPPGLFGPFTPCSPTETTTGRPWASPRPMTSPVP